jgi:hypothetical protein
LLSKEHTNEMDKKSKPFRSKHLINVRRFNDANGGYILHLLAGECSKNDRKIPVLFKTIELEKTNAANINQVSKNFLMNCTVERFFLTR